MSDPNTIRQKVQQAREMSKQGHYVQARALLKGIDHPKVKEMVSQLDVQIAAQPAPIRGKISLVPILGLIAGVAVLLIGVGLLLAQRSRQNLETVVPTATVTLVQDVCTDATINAWWQMQIQPDRELNTFAVDANAAWSTMPGDWLTNQIDRLTNTRAATFIDIPACASPELKSALTSVLVAMDHMLVVLEQWNNGELNGSEITNQFYEANEVFNGTQKEVRKSLP